MPLCGGDFLSRQRRDVLRPCLERFSNLFSVFVSLMNSGHSAKGAAAVVQRKLNNVRRHAQSRGAVTDPTHGEAQPADRIGAHLARFYGPRDDIWWAPRPYPSQRSPR